MTEPKSPAEWCRETQEKAKDGEDAYAYHQLAEMYEQREKE